MILDSISTYKNFNISRKKLKMYFMNEYICKQTILSKEVVIPLLKIGRL